MTRSRCRVAILTLALLAAARPLPAQESPGLLASDEQRCERSTTRSVADFARDAAACFGDCWEAAGSAGYERCRTDSYSEEPLESLRDCLALARARAQVAPLRDCAGDGCLECYAYGAIGDFLPGALATRESTAADRAARIYCDDAYSADGLTARERSCRAGLAAAAAKLSGTLDRCFGRCNRDARRDGRSPEACSPDALDGPDADFGLQRCVDAARARFQRTCDKRCPDLPDCFGSTCDGFVETIVAEDAPPIAEGYCGDQPRCGDGWITSGEECDPAAGGCGAGEFCNASCECEPYPVCGDGAVTGFEQCDQSATPNGCGPGQVCRYCAFCDYPFCGDGVVSGAEVCDPGAPASCPAGQGCAPDCGSCLDLPSPCDAPIPVGSAGGVFLGVTAGASTTTSPCGGSGPEVVYEWTPAASGVARATTCNGYGFDTVVHVRTGSCETAGTLACSDDACGLGSDVQFYVNAGQTYWIFVDGFGQDSSGSFRLDIVPPGGSSPSGAFLE